MVYYIYDTYEMKTIFSSSSLKLTRVNLKNIRKKNKSTNPMIRFRMLKRLKY